MTRETIVLCDLIQSGLQHRAGVEAEVKLDGPLREIWQRTPYTDTTYSLQQVLSLLV
jgi:hypothetical protein